ncbi:MAG: carbon-nitrogen hydrolase family protein, partial [Chloroflexi bacterium]|nr:carbon-nitrogen hydrolase family protein [Chloroflexota bacterium]
MPYLAAAVQRSPGLTLEQGVDNAVAAIEEAGREGASLIVFPETWIPSYPYYHGQSSNRQAFSTLYQCTFENS